MEQRFDAAAQWTPADLANEMGAYFDDRDPERMFSASEALKGLG